MTCYGIIRIVNNYYIVSDLIEDNVEVGTDNQDYEKMVDAAIETYKYRTAANKSEDLTKKLSLLKKASTMMRGVFGGNSSTNQGKTAD